MVVLDFAYRSYLLENGLRVALLPTPTKTIVARLKIFHGAAHEQEGEQGLAHMLEHCLYSAGSRKHTPGEVDQIHELLPKTNAHTTLSNTTFVGRFLGEDLELFLDFTSESVFHPSFDSKIVEQERQRVLREIADRTQGVRMGDRLTYEEALLRGFPQGRMVAGKEEVVRTASIDAMRQFHSRGYHANNACLILVGDLPDNVGEIVQRYFADKSIGEGKPFTFPAVSPLETRTILHTAAPDLRNLNDLLEGGNASINLGLIVPPDTHPDVYALMVMTELLGGGMGTSLLYNEISRQRGLAYRISSSYAGGNNVGMVEVDASVNAPRWDEAVQHIFNTFQRLQNDLIPAQKFERLCKRLLFTFADYNERNSDRGRIIERTLETGVTPEERYTSLAAITPEAVRDAAQKYLPPDREGNYVLLVRDPLKK